MRQALKEGDRILNEDGKEGYIEDVLATMYFVCYDDGTDGFLFINEHTYKEVKA